MSKVKRIKSPTQIELIEPVFAALRDLGGSATITEIRDKVIETLRLPDEIVDEPHKGSDSQRTELEYQLAWARTRLKAFGAITNSQRGVWMITPEYTDKSIVSKAAVVEFFKKERHASQSSSEMSASAEEVDATNTTDNNADIPEELEPWRTELAETLHNMNPYAFERLSMLLLRECGFSQVSVTKKSGDGGIDGTGKLRINGIFSFNVAFQCKRFIGSVSAGDIRDFRGSLTTDIEKGVMITTGTFTKAAREEASNAGKQQIDLIDGEEFINKLIEYRLGVHEKIVYEVDKLFFEKV
ncbi:MAG: restriction endonuclease [Eubacteriales bacterium]|nr:restriction endonuclease [Eubacteriales bacterium]